MVKPSVAVVVPCMNERAHIGKLLEAIADQDLRPSKVVVVDGGSSDGTVAVVREVAARLDGMAVEAIVAPELALPGVINLAVQRAAADIVVRLDAHSEPAPGYIRRAVAHLMDERVGVIGGAWQIQAGADSAMARAIARAVSHPVGAGDAAYRLSHGSETVRDVDTVPFGCFRTATWARVGGLNELLLGNEDYEFNYRVREVGLRVRFDASMQCRYVARASLRGLALQYFRYGWCKVQMLRMHPESLRWRQGIPIAFVATLILLALAAPFSPLAGSLGLALLAVYSVTLAGTAALVGAREGDWRRSAWMPAVFAIVHLTWGTGALVHLVTGGRWPKRDALFGIVRTV